MEGYQFGHLETWSVAGSTGSPHHAERRANGERAWTAAEILDEAERAPGASLHVEAGGEAPQILPGAVASFDQLRGAHAAFTAAFSLPGEVAAKRGDPELRGRCAEVLGAIAHERSRIETLGGVAMMAVVHWDERMVHAHLYAIDPARGRVDHLQSGRAAKRAFEAEPRHAALDKAARNRGGNWAYCAAMRAWQDRLHREVFHGHGLLRLGPRRERLSRADYQHAKRAGAARSADADRQARLDDLGRGLDQREARVAARCVTASESTCLAAWLTDTPTRRSLCLLDGTAPVGFGTIRACRDGLKIGPLVAATPDAALRLLAGLAALFPARPIFRDVPDANTPAMALATRLGFTPTFETARMYRGAPPCMTAGLTWGVGTLELG